MKNLNLAARAASVIELVVVMAIVAVLAAMVIRDSIS
jgi:Tfp pilus assembly protein FimT